MDQLSDIILHHLELTLWFHWWTRNRTAFSTNSSKFIIY